MRNPRRTAQTAGALMIGLALVSTIAVLGASLSASSDRQRRQRRRRRLHHQRLRRVQPAVAPTVSSCRGSRRRRPSIRASSNCAARCPRFGAASTRRPRPDGQARRSRRPGRSGDGRRRAADRHDHGRAQTHLHVGSVVAGHVRPDGSDDDAGRRDLQAEPARGELRRRRRLLPLSLRQPAADRRPAQRLLPAPGISNRR